MDFLKNYVTTVAGRFSGAIATFFSLPFLLEYLGPAEYSLLAFGTLVQGYANILDAGLSPALASTVAQHANYQSKVLEIIAKSTHLLITKLCKWVLPLLMLIFGMAYLTLPYFSIERLAIFCTILMIDACISSVFRLQYATLQGLNEHVIANGLHTLNILARTALAIGMATLSHQVEYMYLSQSLLTSVVILTCFFYYRRRQFLHKASPLDDELPEKSSTSHDLTIIAIFLAVINSLPFVVLGQMGGSNEINLFFLATSLGGIVATLQGSLISVLIPNLSQKLAVASYEENQGNFQRISRSVVCVSFGLAGLAFCLAKPIINIWVHKTGVDQTVLTTLFEFQLISAAFVSLTIVPYALSIPLRHTRIQLIGVGVYLIASCIAMPLARHFGSIELFGFISMVLGVCFSTGYFLFSSSLMIANGQAGCIWGFIVSPAIYIGTALTAANISVKMLLSEQILPEWLLTLFIYGALASIFILFKKFSFMPQFFIGNINK